MKHDAIVDQGIPIHERVPIPDDMIPADSRVEIDAKIQAGYFTTGTVMSMEELANVKGRGWEDIDVRTLFPLRYHLHKLTYCAALSKPCELASMMQARVNASSEDPARQLGLVISFHKLQRTRTQCASATGYLWMEQLSDRKPRSIPINTTQQANHDQCISPMDKIAPAWGIFPWHPHHRITLQAADETPI